MSDSDIQIRYNQGHKSCELGIMAHAVILTLGWWSRRTAQTLRESPLAGFMWQLGIS